VYEPIRFVVSSGGKRLRATLLMLSCEAVGGNTDDALNAAAAIEMLHNFTLVHDDVMDNAPLRRGRPTVHKKWDENVAILAGDEMIGLAYEALLKTPAQSIPGVADIFTRALVEVCEGQGLDKEFECRTDVTLPEYLRMIRKKTARIIAAACEIGAVIGRGSRGQVAALRMFGDHLGMAFQMKDDLLDVTGEEKDFGKAIGSDILEKKKTVLLLTAISKVGGADRKYLKHVSSQRNGRRVDIGRVRDIYERHGIIDSAERGVRRRTAAAQRALGRLPGSGAREVLHWLSGKMSERNR